MKNNLRAFLSIATLFGSLQAAQSFTEQERDEIWSSPNPMAKALWIKGQCNLVTPVQAEVDRVGEATRNARGTVLHLPNKRGQFWNINAPNALPFCSPPTWRPRNPIPEQFTGDYKFDMSYRKEANIGASLKIGQLFSIADVQAKFLDAIRFGFELGGSEFGQNLQEAVGKDFKSNFPTCKAWNHPQGYVITKVCFGHMFVAMTSERGLSLKALDATFNTLTVGIKADWTRQIKGEITQCPPEQKARLEKEKEDAAALAEKKKVAEAKAAQEADPVKKKQILDSVGAIIDLVSALTEKKPEAKDNLSAPPKIATQTATPDANNKGCINNIVYTTLRPVILGVDVHPVGKIKELIQ